MQAFSVLIRSLCIENISMIVKLGRIQIFLLVISATLLFCGCSKDEEPRFTMPVEVALFFPAEFNTIETHTVEFFSVPNQLQLRLEQNGMTEDQITSIVSGRGQIIPVTSNVQYQLMNNIRVNVSSIDNDSDINEMYYNDFIEFDHEGNLELLSSISELKDIMKEGVFNLQIKYNLRQSLLTATEHKLRFDLLIYD